MKYEVHTTYDGQWSNEVGEPNVFSSVGEAEKAIAVLKTLGDAWLDAEYRVMEVRSVGYTLLEAYSEAVPISSNDLRDEAERIWRDDDIAGRDMLAGRIQLYDADGRALATTADYLWCPEVGRLGIANGGDADWLDADSLDEGIRLWLSEEARTVTKQCIRLEELVDNCRCRCGCHDGQCVEPDYDPDCSSCCLDPEIDGEGE